MLTVVFMRWQQALPSANFVIADDFRHLPYPLHLNPLRGATRVGGIRSRIGAAAYRGTSLNSSKSGSRPLGSRMPRLRLATRPNPGLGTFRLVQRGQGEGGMPLRDLWARHPEITGGSVHHVQAVSSRAIPSPRRAAPGPCRTAGFTTVPGTQKALSLVGKGPYLRKLVAGAGFEPATSGL
jgi:hypothetical protein